MRLMTLNMNGIRSAQRKGFWEWFATQNIDILCVQETKAQLAKLTDDVSLIPGYHRHFVDAQKPGYSGVAIYSRQRPDDVVTSFGHSVLDDEGRYICCRFGDVYIASLYLHSGTSGDHRQTLKYEAMDALRKDLLEPVIDENQKMIIAGDWNIAHQKIDIKNWQSNQNSSGFLPEERAWLSDILALGWVDSLRQMSPDEVAYTWWSFRANARVKNVGWRIDYQLCSPAMASYLQAWSIHREPLFSDHAPMTVSYDCELQ